MAVARTRSALTFLVVVGVLSAVYLAAPETWGALAYLGTAVAGLAGVALGPVFRRPANRAPWNWLLTSGLLFFVGQLAQFGVVDRLGEGDGWAFAGYACLALFLLGLLRRTSAVGDLSVWLDTAAVVVGSLLVGWVMNVAPQLAADDRDVWTVVVNTVYPVADTLLLALTVQLWLRRGSQNVALLACLVSMAALLGGDLGYTFVWAQDPDAVNVYVNVFYIVAYAGLGVTAAHPSMRELSDVDVRRPPSSSRARLVLVFLAMVAPAAIPVMLPVHGSLDATVRALGMATFAALVYLRLLHTVRALDESRRVAQHRSTHDLLTGLPNRAAMLGLLTDALAEGPVTAALIDCDRFTNINDSWGHQAGDEVLSRVAGRLTTIMRDGEKLARIGGDEFLLAAPGADPVSLGRRVMSAFAEPFGVRSAPGAGRTWVVTASVGIAVGSADAEEVLRDADVALHQAKADGRATAVVYDAELRERNTRRLVLAAALNNAILRGEITVVYQPIRTGPGYAELSGWEALVRWGNAEVGFVSPVEFIPIAEDTGLIVDIGAFVLRTACRQLRAWQAELGNPDLHVSVNLSAVQLRRDDVRALVRDVLAETGLPPACLWLEVTESTLLADDVLDTLADLSALGVKLCMDDFGTGYSSLSYLKSFEVHTLKIDRAFVTDLATDARDRELVRAIISFAAALELHEVVAEGVENVEQARVLEELGCRSVQGYYYGKPLPPADALVAARSAARGIRA